jgi:hypothetical protein
MGLANNSNNATEKIWSIIIVKLKFQLFLHQYKKLYIFVYISFSYF